MYAVYIKNKTVGFAHTHPLFEKRGAKTLTFICNAFRQKLLP